jgi:hypothetical protein
MSTIRVGATKKFADNWENIFGGKKKPTATGKPSSKSAKKSPKKVTSKLGAKKRSGKK